MRWRKPRAFSVLSFERSCGERPWDGEEAAVEIDQGISVTEYGLGHVADEDDMGAILDELLKPALEAYKRVANGRGAGYACRPLANHKSVAGGQGRLTREGSCDIFLRV